MRNLILVLLACGLSAGCGRSVRSYFAPDGSTVTEMTACLYNRPDKGEDIDFFAVPKESYQSVLGTLGGAEENKNPSGWQVLVGLKIASGTQTMNVILFWTQAERGAFKVNDSYYRGGSDAAFIKMVVDAHKQQAEHGSAGQPAKAPESKPEGKEKSESKPGESPQ
jgi:hypothetical protein